MQAWNYLGAASELAGRGTQAVAAYRRALGLLEDQRERFEATAGAEGREVWEEAVRLTKGNVGRALVLVGGAEEAVACLGEAEPAQVCMRHETVVSRCGCRLSLLLWLSFIVADGGGTVWSGLAVCDLMLLATVWESTSICPSCYALSLSIVVFRCPWFLLFVVSTAS